MRGGGRGPVSLQERPMWLVELWSINRWLRWTGFRLVIEFDRSEAEDRAPTRIGLVWWGWQWDRVEGRR